MCARFHRGLSAVNTPRFFPEAIHTLQAPKIHLFSPKTPGDARSGRSRCPFPMATGVSLTRCRVGGGRASPPAPLPPAPAPVSRLLPPRKIKIFKKLKKERKKALNPNVNKNSAPRTPGFGRVTSERGPNGFKAPRARSSRSHRGPPGPKGAAAPAGPAPGLSRPGAAPRPSTGPGEPPGETGEAPKRPRDDGGRVGKGLGGEATAAPLTAGRAAPQPPLPPAVR